VNEQELIAFESEIAELFNAGEIRAPVHLHGGNERQLIEIFKLIKPDDWIFSSHRSHYHALLKGIPPELVKAEILKGNSISLQFPQYRFHTSAIVGGIIPIALGVAMTGDTVWCFVGDMAANTGIFHECAKYADGHRLSIHFVIEDNDMSVDTPTRHVWGGQSVMIEYPFTEYYKYIRIYPHAGTGKWITEWK